jgi:type III secretion system chaperone SycN
LSWVDDAVATFGERLSLDGVALPEAGAVAFDFASGGSLQLERSGDDLLVSLQRTYPFAPRQQLERALELCHWRHNRGFDPHVGLSGDDTVFVIRLQGRQVTPVALEQAIELLRELHQQLQT